MDKTIRFATTNFLGKIQTTHKFHRAENPVFELSDYRTIKLDEPKLKQLLARSTLINLSPLLSPQLSKQSKPCPALIPLMRAEFRQLMTNLLPKRWKNSLFGNDGKAQKNL